MRGSMDPNRDNLFLTRPVAIGAAFFLSLFGVLLGCVTLLHGVILLGGTETGS